MLKPSDRVNQSIDALDGNIHWEEIKKWILDSFAKQTIDSVVDFVSTDSQHRINQGRVYELLKLKEYILNARKNLEESKQLAKSQQQKRTMESV